MPRQTFQEISKQVAQKFLQTVVVVDDQAFLANSDAVYGTELDRTQTTALVAPTIGNMTDVPEEDPAEKTHDEQETARSQNSDEQHDLNAKRLIDEFAQKGLFCSVLRPERRDEPLLEKVLEVARRADLVVLDWQIFKDNGDRTKEIIKEILKKDEKTGLYQRRQLRLITVYSGEPDMRAITDSIETMLQESGFNPKKEENGLILCVGPVRIVVFAKHHAKVPPHHNTWKLTVEELPERLIAEFSNMTAGLVSNAVIESLSVLRNNTYSLLTTLHKGLDAPYLTHRALIPHPDDASDFLVSLVVEELRSLLEEHDIGLQAGDEAIKSWLESKERDSFSVNYKEIKSLSYEQMLAWLLEGKVADLDDKKSNDLRKQVFKRLTQMFCEQAEVASKLDTEFAVLSSVRTQYGLTETGPVLTLGTIIKDVTETDETSEKPLDFKFWFCIQPRCDSVRLKGSTDFPFLPCKEVNGDGSFDITVKLDGDFMHLKLESKPSKSRLFTFSPKPETSEVIRAERHGTDFIFQAADRRFKWVADLKNDHAQRIINEYAATISRVGLDEFEWARRSRK